MSRYKVRYLPVGSVAPRDLGVGVRLQPVPVPCEECPPAADPGACVPAITGLFWFNPSTLAFDLTSATAQVVYGDYGPYGVGWYPKSPSPWLFLAQVMGDTCECAEIEWTFDVDTMLNYPYSYKSGRVFVCAPPVPAFGGGSGFVDAMTCTLSATVCGEAVGPISLEISEYP